MLKRLFVFPSASGNDRRGGGSQRRPPQRTTRTAVVAGTTTVIVACSTVFRLVSANDFAHRGYLPQYQKQCFPVEMSQEESEISVVGLGNRIWELPVASSTSASTPVELLLSIGRTEFEETGKADGAGVAADPAVKKTAAAPPLLLTVTADTGFRTLVHGVAARGEFGGNKELGIDVCFSPPARQSQPAAESPADSTSTTSTALTITKYFELLVTSASDMVTLEAAKPTTVTVDVPGGAAAADGQATSASGTSTGASISWRDFRLHIPPNTASVVISAHGEDHARTYMVADVRHFARDPRAYRWTSGPRDEASVDAKIILDGDGGGPGNFNSSRSPEKFCHYKYGASAHAGLCYLYVSAYAWKVRGASTSSAASENADDPTVAKLEDAMQNPEGAAATTTSAPSSLPSIFSALKSDTSSSSASSDSSSAEGASGGGLTQFTITAVITSTDGTIFSSTSAIETQGVVEGDPSPSAAQVGEALKKQLTLREGVAQDVDLVDGKPQNFKFILDNRDDGVVVGLEHVRGKCRVQVRATVDDGGDPLSSVTGVSSSVADDAILLTDDSPVLQEAKRIAASDGDANAMPVLYVTAGVAVGGAEPLQSATCRLNVRGARLVMPLEEGATVSGAVRPDVLNFFSVTPADFKGGIGGGSGEIFLNLNGIAGTSVNVCVKYEDQPSSGADPPAAGVKGPPRSEALEKVKVEASSGGSASGVDVEEVQKQCDLRTDSAMGLNTLKLDLGGHDASGRANKRARIRWTAREVMQMHQTPALEKVVVHAVQDREQALSRCAIGLKIVLRDGEMLMDTIFNPKNPSAFMLPAGDSTKSVAVAQAMASSRTYKFFMADASWMLDKIVIELTLDGRAPTSAKIAGSDEDTGAAGGSSAPSPSEEARRESNRSTPSAVSATSIDCVARGFGIKRRESLKNTEDLFSSPYAMTDADFGSAIETTYVSPETSAVQSVTAEVPAALALNYRRHWLQVTVGNKCDDTNLQYSLLVRSVLLTEDAAGGGLEKLGKPRELALNAPVQHVVVGDKVEDERTSVSNVVSSVSAAVENKVEDAKAAATSVVGAAKNAAATAEKAVEKSAETVVETITHPIAAISSAFSASQQGDDKRTLSLDVCYGNFGVAVGTSLKNLENRASTGDYPLDADDEFVIEKREANALSSLPAGTAWEGIRPSYEIALSSSRGSTTSSSSIYLTVEKGDGYDLQKLPGGSSAAAQDQAAPADRLYVVLRREGGHGVVAQPAGISTAVATTPPESFMLAVYDPTTTNRLHPETRCGLELILAAALTEKRWNPLPQIGDVWYEMDTTKSGHRLLLVQGTNNPFADDGVAAGAAGKNNIAAFPFSLELYRKTQNWRAISAVVLDTQNSELSGVAVLKSVRPLGLLAQVEESAEDAVNDLERLFKKKLGIENVGAGSPDVVAAEEGNASASARHTALTPSCPSLVVVLAPIAPPPTFLPRRLPRVLSQAQSSYVAFLNAKLARFSRPFCLAITISVCNLIFFVGMFAGLTGVCPVEKYSSLQIAPMGQIDWMQKAGTISCLQMVGYIYYDTRIGFAELTAQPHPDITKLGEQNAAPAATMAPAARGPYAFYFDKRVCRNTGEALGLALAYTAYCDMIVTLLALAVGLKTGMVSIVGGGSLRESVMAAVNEDDGKKGLMTRAEVQLMIDQSLSTQQKGAVLVPQPQPTLMA
eukprot:g12045.t1